MIVIPGSSRYVKFLPKITKEENLPQKAEILHTVPRRSTNVYPWWLLNFWESMVFSVCFLYIFLQDKYASALMWSGCRKRSCQGWMWMRCQAAAAFAGKKGVDPLPPPVVVCLWCNPSLPGFPSSSLSWFRFVKGWDFPVPPPSSGGSLWPSTSRCLWSG